MTYCDKCDTLCDITQNCDTFVTLFGNSLLHLELLFCDTFVTKRDNLRRSDVCDKRVKV